MGAAALLLGVAGLTGWLFDIRALYAVMPTWTPMRPNAALCLTLCGGILLFCGGERPSGSAVLVRRVGGSLLALFGLLSLAEYALGVDAGVEQWLPADQVSTAPRATPAGRLAHSTAVAMMCLGVAIALLDAGVCRRMRLACASTALALGMIVVLGYCFGAGERLASDVHWAMAFATACG